MLLLPDAVTWLGIFDSSEMSSRNLSSSNLNFSVLTLSMSLRYFGNKLYKRGRKYSYCIFLKGLCWVSVCWILNSALRSMSWVFSGLPTTNLQQFYFVCKNCENTKHLNNFSRCMKTIENIIQPIICKIIYH